MCIRVQILIVEENKNIFSISRMAISGCTNLSHIFLVYVLFTDQSRIHPPEQLVYKGYNAIFYCHSSGLVDWQFNGQIFLPSNVYEFTATCLYIEKVDLPNQGFYQCKGENNFSETFYAQGQLKIIGRWSLAK